MVGAIPLEKETISHNSSSTLNGIPPSTVDNPVSPYPPRGFFGCFAIGIVAVVGLLQYYSVMQIKVKSSTQKRLGFFSETIARAYYFTSFRLYDVTMKYTWLL